MHEGEPLMGATNSDGVMVGVGVGFQIYMSIFFITCGILANTSMQMLNEQHLFLFCIHELCYLRNCH